MHLIASCLTIALLSLHVFGFPSASFDSRTRWPRCANITGATPDQGACGWCWALTSVLTVASRMCIKEAEEAAYPSLDAAIACDGVCGDCAGGSAACALVEWTRSGTPLSSDPLRSPSSSSCVRGHQLERIAIFHRDPDGVARSIYSQGPCLVNVDAICRHDDDNCEPLPARHFVRILGWTAQGTWLVANTWGDGWGDRGTYQTMSGFGKIDETVYCPIV